MEPVITRDTDILREYLAALDARERGLSPFAKLAATMKLAGLKREIDSTHLEAGDDDIAGLKREIDERLDRNMSRRFESKRLGARLSIFLMLVLGQQLVLLLVWLSTKLFVAFVAPPRRWNPVLPHEQPVFLYIFIFFFFFMTPMLALAVLFGGRYFRSWRKTIPATLAIMALAVVATFLVVRDKEKNNPVRHKTSLEEVASLKSVIVPNYREWVGHNWLLKDEKFQRDYEQYLRKGPGRWITSQFNSNDDAAWRGALPIMNDYAKSGQDENAMREWLAYYFDRNRIYAGPRINEEVDRLVASRENFSLWQLEPYLKERDQRLYRAYLGSINASMKGWGIAVLALVALIFLVIYLVGPMMSRWERSAASPAPAPSVEYADGTPAPHLQGPPRVRERYDFPERVEIATPSFFDTPLRMLARVHRSFVRTAIFTSIFVFAFWALVYALDLAAGHEEAPSQVAMMRSNLLFGGQPDRDDSEEGNLVDVKITEARNSSSYATTLNPMPDTERNELRTATGERREELLARHVMGLENEVGEGDYQTTRKFKEQYETLQAQGQSIEGNRSEIATLRNQADQLQMATSTTLPQQIAQVNSQVESRAGQVSGQVSAARAETDKVEKQLNAKMKDVESRVSTAAEQAGRAEDQARAFQTRSEESQTVINRDINELKERTSALGNRMTTIEDREGQVRSIEQLQRIAFTAILSDINAGVEDLGRRVNSAFYKMFNKGEAARDADLLRQRITSLKSELEKINTDQTKQMIEQLDQVSNRLEEIARSIK